MNDFGHGHGWGMVWFWLLGLIFLILFVWFIIRIIGTGGPQAGTGQRSALDILKERYASGEIDKKEYEDKKRDLM